MKNYFASILLFVSAGSFAQTLTEKLPEFVGGENQLMQFLSENIHYPVAAKDNGITGTVIVSFGVDTVGGLDSIVVSHSVHPSLDKEALRVVNLMRGKCKPGSLNGKPVHVKYRLPIQFRIKEGSGYPSSTYNYNKGVEAAGKNDFQNALIYYNDAMDSNNSDIDILYNRGICKFKLGDRDGACKDWSRIHELKKKDADDLLEKYCK